MLQSIYKYFILKEKGFKYLHISEINYECYIHIYRGFNFNFFLLADYKPDMWCSGAGHIVKNWKIRICLLLPLKYEFLNTGDFFKSFWDTLVGVIADKFLVVLY